MALRAEFNPDYQFIVTSPRGLVVASSLYKMGAPFDKGLVTTRLLRQLYDARQIDRAPEVAAPAELILPTTATETEAIAPKRVRRRRFNYGGSS